MPWGGLGQPLTWGGSFYRADAAPVSLSLPDKGLETGFAYKLVGDFVGQFRTVRNVIK